MVFLYQKAHLTCTTPVPRSASYHLPVCGMDARFKSRVTRHWNHELIVISGIRWESKYSSNLSNKPTASNMWAIQ